MEDFFRSIGMPTSISDMEIELTDTQIKELAHKCSFMGRRTIGGFVILNAAVMKTFTGCQIKQYKKHKTRLPKGRHVFLLRPNCILFTFESVSYAGAVIISL